MSGLFLRQRGGGKHAKVATTLAADCSYLSNTEVARREKDLPENAHVQQRACSRFAPLLRRGVGLGGGVGVVAESVQWDQKLSKLPLQQ